jgi:hypothetical protein
MRAISSRRSGVERQHLGRDAFALADVVLDDPEMLVGARRDLRRVGDGEHLRLGGEPREPLADRVRDRAADAAVDLVEHQGRRGVALGERHFQREQEARELAAGGDLHQRPGREPGLVWTVNSARS